MSTELKIYVRDMGWAGSIVVVAASEDEARQMILAEDKCAFDRPIKGDLIHCYDIKPGLIHYNMGDQ